MVAPASRSLLIGFDGGTWKLLDPALRAGLLPNLQRFLDRGLRGTLRSVVPAVTIPAWYSATTGCSPGTLDMWGFTAPAPERGRFSLVSTYRPHEALWDRLGRKGWRVGVVNFPALPAPPVHGYFISGMLDPRGAATTYPTSLADRLRSELGGWDTDLPEFGPGQHEAAFARAVASLGQKARAVEMLQGEHHPELLFVLFSETDRLQHNFYDVLARSPTSTPGVRDFWRSLDSAFHRVHAAFHRDAPTEGYTWLLSDHGFGPAEGYFFTNRFLERRGYLRVKPGAPTSTRLRPWVSDTMARADQAVPLKDPLRWADHLRHRLSPRTAERDGDTLDQTFGWFSQFVDWESTRALSFPVPEAIYANSFRGPVSREERGRLRQEIEKDLRALPAAQVEAVDPEALYGRELSSTSPILLISSHQGGWEPRGDVNHRVDYLPRRPSYFQREGNHRPDGIVALTGPGVPSGRLDGPMSLLSVAPTVLALLDDPDASTLDAPPHAELSRWGPGAGARS